MSPSLAPSRFVMIAWSHSGVRAETMIDRESANTSFLGIFKKDMRSIYLSPAVDWSLLVKVDANPQMVRVRDQQMFNGTIPYYLDRPGTTTPWYGTTNKEFLTHE